MDLDTAIREAAAQMGENLPGGTKVALVSVASSSAQFSEYVISRLEAALVSGKKLVVVDRANLDKIREEQGFQASGEVDDDSAKSIGKLLGAGAIVTGAFANLGDVYSLTLKAINIETATVAASYPADIAKSVRIETLLASGGGARTGTRTAQAGGSTASATQTATSTPVAQDPAATSTPATQDPAATPAPVVQTPAQTAQTTRVAQTPVPETPKTYKIGDTGPAGGFIFYDKGNDSGGWRYLEAAPASTEGKALQWSVSAFDTGAKGSEAGTGKQNTRNIMDASVQVAVNAPAARLCDRLAYGGYDDWYLPSKNELGLMYMNLKVDGIGGLGNEWYWSSSESGIGSGVWIQNFGNGQQYAGLSYDSNTQSAKDKGHNVRAIRQF
jgi:hypothetical protein